MKISEIITDKYKLRMPPTVYYELLADVLEAEEEQEPKTGHWIADVDKWGDVVTTVNGYKCSECGEFNDDKDKYCPNCGVKMSESKRYMELAKSYSQGLRAGLEESEDKE